MQYQTIELSDLKTAKLNVRKIGGKDVADLVPSIRSLGLLQPLLVRKNCQGFEIVAGQRRFHALRKIAESETVDAVPCVIMEDGDDAKAIEASLAENIARLPMNEIDQYKAFAALIKQGGTVEDIAAQFGITKRLVKQRLAIANLIPPLLTAYRKDGIDPQTLRLLTMATKAQQKEWLDLYRSDEDYAPEGYRLKCWLFGGAEISTDAALFNLEDYTGNIVSDLFDERRYFDDADTFWQHQNAAIAKKRDAYLADGWAEVHILDIGEHFSSWDYIDTPKESGGKVYIVIARNGEVTPYEGQLSRKEVRAREKAKEAGETELTARPELTQPMQNYLDLHRHAAVRAELLGHAGIALRLAVAQIIAGSELWRVEADPQRAKTDAIEESLATNTAQAAFETERDAIRDLLAINIDEADVAPLHSVFAHLLTLADENVTRILTFLVAESLPCGSAMVEALGNMLAVDTTNVWTPDETFLSLLRDKVAINAILKDVAGKATADAHIGSTAKVQKGIIVDCLNGTRKKPKDGWQPRYFAFPMRGYTKQGGIRTIDQWKTTKHHYA